MRIDTLALRMRPRAPLEAADLGARLCQTTARSVYFCYAVAYLPVLALALASFEIAAWAPSALLFWSKPWLDRFRYGPFEWLWRSLARGKLQPMRR